MDKIGRLDLTKKNNDLFSEIATRETSFEFIQFIGLLPDIDPILIKLSDSGHSILKNLLADSQVLSCIQARKLAVLKKEFKLKPGVHKDEDKPSDKSINLCNDLSDDITKLGIKRLHDFIGQLMDAPFFGFVPCELIFQPEKGKIRIKEIRTLPNHWFGFDIENKPRFISMDNPWEGEILPQYKFVFATHFPNFENPYGLRLLSRCYWPVQFKKGGIKFWLKFLEKFGIPYLFGKYPKGAGDNVKTKLLNDLMRMHQTSVAIGPEGSNLDILSIAGKTNGELFKDLKIEMDNEISKILQGQAQSLNIGEQSTYASASKVGDKLDDYTDADLLLIKTTFDEISYNYTQINAPDIPAPTLEFFEESDPKKEHAERDKTLYSAGARFSKDYFMRTYGYLSDEVNIVENQSFASSVSNGNYTPEQETLEELSEIAINEAANLIHKGIS